jgi:hypothetical protein
MKSNKIIGFLLGAIVVLTAAKFGVGYWQDRSPDADFYRSFWQQASAHEVATIVIAKGEQQLTLNKTNDSIWMADDYPANSTEIQEWLPQLITPRNPELVAETAVNHQALGITPESAVITVMVKGQEKKLTLGAPALNGRYLQPEGSDRVYLVTGLPAYLNSVEVADWIDNTLVRIDQSNITGLEWNREKVSFKLTQESGGWKNSEGKSLDTTVLNPVLMSLESLVTQGLWQPAEGDDWPEKPEFTLVVYRSSGEPMALDFFRIGERRAVTASTRPGSFAVSETVFDTFNLQLANLRVK